MGTVKIVGIGSPAGDDQVGWQAVEYLQQSGIAGEFGAGRVVLVTCPHPARGLWKEICDGDLVILIDALRTDAPAGTIHRLEGNEIPAAGVKLSSHDFGVAAVVGLAHALGDLPERLVLYGVAVDGCTPVESLSTPVQAAFPELLRRIREELRRPVTDRSK